MEFSLSIGSLYIALSFPFVFSQIGSSSSAMISTLSRKRVMWGVLMSGFSLYSEFSLDSVKREASSAET